MTKMIRNLDYKMCEHGVEITAKELIKFITTAMKRHQKYIKFFASDEMVEYYKRVYNFDSTSYQATYFLELEKVHKHMKLLNEIFTAVYGCPDDQIITIPDKDFYDIVKYYKQKQEV